MLVKKPQQTIIKGLGLLQAMPRFRGRRIATSTVHKIRKLRAISEEACPVASPVYWDDLMHAAATPQFRRIQG